MTRAGKKSQAPKDNFFMVGAKSFMDAIVALREYNRLVVKVSREALESRISDFETVLGQKLAKSDIKTANDLKNILEVDNENAACWLGVSVGSLPKLCVGMSIGDKERPGEPIAIVTIEPKDENFDALKNACEAAADPAEELYCWTVNSEIYMAMPFDSMEDFQGALNKISGLWLKILRP